MALTGLALTMVGACQRILDLVLDHVRNRKQFGVPIGAFQAVQHKAADMHVAIERARALGYFAALIPTDIAGVVCRPFASVCDRDDLDFNEVFFTDARLPAENLVGPLNQGWFVANGSLGHERTLLWMSFADRLQELITDVRPTSVIDRGRYATLVMDTQALRLLGSKALAREARGEQDVPALSVLKLLGSEAVQTAPEHAMTAEGTDGLTHPATTGPYAPLNEDNTTASWFDPPAASPARSPAAPPRFSATSSPNESSAYPDIKEPGLRAQGSGKGSRPSWRPSQP